MKKMEVDDYKGLVAASSIIRPGVSKSGMMQEYIKRHRNPSARAATHPVLGEILNETYGVMVYQEDVLKVAHYFAGLTLEESDVLRRGMSWKFRERPEFHKVKKQFFDRCKERNYNINLVSEVWRQIESFANYAFAKGHSASYAVESYQSLFLKAYYPLEYMVATINNFGGFYSTEHYIQEARLKGASIVPPCINEAQKITTIKGKTIMLGFQHIKNLDNRVVNDLLFQRTINGPYNDLEDFVNRVSINLEMLINLIRVNAFRFTGIQKTELLWKAHFMLSGSIKKQRDQASLFDYVNRKKVAIPSLTPIKHEDAYDDIENFGFPLCSPFDLIERKELEGTIISKRFKDFKGRKVKILGYLVHQKKNMTRSNDPQLMSFGTFMDYAGEFYESVHFPDSLRYYKFKGKGIYQMEGRVTEDFGHYSLDVIRMTKLAYTKLVDEV